MAKIYLILGSVNMFLAVTLGAFGAHGLKSKLSKEMMTIYETAVNYHMVHALGVILIGIIIKWLAHSSLLNWSGGLLLAGILIFSGSLYALSISGIRILGAITPIGGLAFLAGWILLAIAAWKNL